MVSSDFRKDARQKLSGKWGKVAVITLLFTLISVLFSVLENIIKVYSVNIILNIAQVIIMVPLSFGYAFSLYKIFKGEDVEYSHFFSLGFNNFSRSWLITLNTILKLIIPVIILIVSIILVYAGVPSPENVIITDNSISFSITPQNSTLVILGGLLSIAAYIWLFVKGLYYAFANLIAYDDTSISPKDAVEKSEQ